MKFLVETSARHAHVTQADLEKLFGPLNSLLDPLKSNRMAYTLAWSALTLTPGVSAATET